MAYHSVGKQAMQWLDRKSPGASSGLLRQAYDLARLQADIDAWAAGSRLRLLAGPIKDAALRLFTDHPAMLARARQQLPSLQQHLNAKGWRLDRLDLKVRTAPREAPQTVRPKRGQFGSQAVNSWVDLTGKLEDERLKAAVARLCERNGWNQP